VSISDQQNNPLIPAVLQVLRQHPGPLAIHQLLQQLKQVCAIPVLDSDEQIALFKLNWLMMNALYQLQADFYQQDYYLHISTLNIQLQAIHSTQDKQIKQGAKQALRDYYLDWRQFSETSKAQVEDLLAGVWQFYINDEKEQKAYAILGLQPSASLSVVRQTYRSLVGRYHPDKGGDAGQFMQVREAYEVLVKARSAKGSRDVNY